MKSFADKLRELMADRGLSIAELGRRTGIDRGTIHHYLSGDYLPKLDKTEKLAAALGCSVSYLTGLTDEPAPCTTIILVTAGSRRPAISRVFLRKKSRTLWSAS